MTKTDSQVEISGLLILTSTTLPGTDHAAFNRWYNEVHVPDILTIAEFTSCTRYKVSTARLFPEVLQSPDYEYAAVYQVTAKNDSDMQAAVERLNELSSKDISSSSAFDNTRTTATFLLPISEEITKDLQYKHSGCSGT